MNLLKSNIFMFMMIAIILMVAIMPTTVLADKKAGDMFTVEVSEGGIVDIKGGGVDTTEDAWQTILNKVRDGVGFFGGLMLIIFVGIFILLFSKLAAAGDNPQKRKEIQTSIMWAFVAAAGLGSVATVVALAYRFFI